MKVESQRMKKNAQIVKEGKIISKKEKEAKKLEILESEVLRRLRDTHMRQQEVIEEIQGIFKAHKTWNGPNESQTTTENNPFDDGIVSS